MKKSPLRLDIEEAIKHLGLLFLEEDSGVYSYEDTERSLKIVIFHKDQHDEVVRIAFGFVGFTGKFINITDFLDSKISNLSHAFGIIHEKIIPKVENAVIASRIGSEGSKTGDYLLNGNCHSFGNQVESKIKRYFESEAQARSFVSLVSEFIECGEATLYKVSGKEKSGCLKIVFDNGSETIEPLSIFPSGKGKKAS